MKGLLHSKKFRTNLLNWLCMYVGVMALLTTVITYSKYIESQSQSDEARVPKFDVNYGKVSCDGSNEQDCYKDILTAEQLPVVSGDYDYSTYITRTMPFYFYVDYKELEVDTELILTFARHEKFDIVEIEEAELVLNPSTKVPELTTRTLYSKESSNNSAVISTNVSTGLESVDSTLRLSIKKDNLNLDVGRSVYKVTLKYNCKDHMTDGVCDLNEDLNLTPDKIVQIGYSAMQKTK